MNNSRIHRYTDAGGHKTEEGRRILQTMNEEELRILTMDDMGATHLSSVHPEDVAAFKRWALSGGTDYGN